VWFDQGQMMRKASETGANLRLVVFTLFALISPALHPRTAENGTQGHMHTRQVLYN
jgi:hypothetical protein